MKVSHIDEIAIGALATGKRCGIAFLIVVACLVWLTTTSCVPYRVTYNQYVKQSESTIECGAFRLDARLGDGPDHTIRLSVSMRSLEYVDAVLVVKSAKLTFEDGASESFLTSEATFKGPEREKSWMIEDKSGHYFLVSSSVGQLVSRYPDPGETVVLTVEFQVNNHDAICKWENAFVVDHVDNWTMLSIFTTP